MDFFFIFLFVCVSEHRREGKDCQRDNGGKERSDKNDGRDAEWEMGEEMWREMGTRQTDGRTDRQRVSGRLRANNYSLCLAASMTMYHNNPSLTQAHTHTQEAHGEMKAFSSVLGIILLY